MLTADGLIAVVYAASAQSRIDDPESLVRAVAQAAAPYALAAEREADRASAVHDGLTGLFTPRAFRQRLQEELSVARLNPHATVALWFIDTDNFKQVETSNNTISRDKVPSHGPSGRLPLTLLVWRGTLGLH